MCLEALEEAGRGADGGGEEAQEGGPDPQRHRVVVPDNHTSTRWRLSAGPLRGVIEREGQGATVRWESRSNSRESGVENVRRSWESA